MKSKRTMRRAILQSLFEHLERNYDLSWPDQDVMKGQVSLHDVDVLLAFKSDLRLDELRGALARLETGLYGVCALCKTSITEEVLESDSAARFCKDCEKTFSTVDTRRLHAVAFS